MQCEPCDRCTKQAVPMFNPSKSSTYEDVSCYLRECSWLSRVRCDPDEGRICQSHWDALDGTYTKGNFARATFKLDSTSGRTVSFNRMMFGCEHDSRIHNYDRKYSGVIRHGSSGRMSLLAQLGRAANGKFSYCLLTFLRTMSRTTSWLNVGERAMVKGVGTMCSPIVMKKTSYCLSLYGVTIENSSNKTGSKVVDYLAMPENVESDLYTDTGTTISYLNEHFYNGLELVVARHVGLPRVPSPVKYLRLSYRLMMTKSDAPILRFRFVNANMDLGLGNNCKRGAIDKG